MFCGNWVDSYAPENEGEQDYKMKIAIEHRNRLIDYDENSTKRMGIKDQKSDWFEIENDTWQSRENWEKAKLIREREEKRKMKDEEDLNVTIGLSGGLVDLTYSWNVSKT